MVRARQPFGVIMTECCGVCDEVIERGSCVCEWCQCNHCIHDHEKWRFGRLCKICTPLAYAEEYPNEVSDRGAMETEVMRHQKRE